MSKPNPVLTIHGLLSSIDYFSFQAYLEGVDVRTPDRLGYETQRGSADPGGITLQGQARHVADYLRRHLRQPAWILGNQSATNVQAMARAVVKETASEAYLASVKSVVDRGTPIHLIAGETSRASWDVPAWIAAAAQSDTMLPGVGHMMMLETPQAFCHAVREVLQSG